MRWKAILLDADGTFMDFQAAEECALTRLMERLQIQNPGAMDVYKRCNNACWKALERGEITPKALETLRFKMFLDECGLGQDPQEVSEMYIDLLSQQRFVLPGAEAAIEALSREHLIAVVTNGIARVQHGRLDALPFREALGPLIISGELGVAKPNPEIVFEALKRLNVSCEEALLVGDSLTSDIRAANAAGVDACWIAPIDQPLPEGYQVTLRVASLAELPQALQSLE